MVTLENHLEALNLMELIKLQSWYFDMGDEEGAASIYDYVKENYGPDWVEE